MVKTSEQLPRVNESIIFLCEIKENFDAIDLTPPLQNTRPGFDAIDLITPFQNTRPDIDAIDLISPFQNTRPYIDVIDLKLSYRTLDLILMQQI